MRVGLLRHFPVVEPFPTGWKTAEELDAWMARYDAAPAVVGAFDLGGIAWETCLSSDAERARVTAAAVFGDGVTHTPLLCEASFAPFATGRLRLPVGVWRWVLRLSWMTGHRSQRARRDEFRTRVGAVAEELCAGGRDTLVVSHAGMMAYLSRELRRRGFAGPKLRDAGHATVYVYERGGA